MPSKAVYGYPAGPALPLRKRTGHVRNRKLRTPVYSRLIVFAHFSCFAKTRTALAKAVPRTSASTAIPHIDSVAGVRRGVVRRERWLFRGKKPKLEIRCAQHPHKDVPSTL